MHMQLGIITICAKSLQTCKSGNSDPSLFSSIDDTEQPLPTYKSKPRCGSLLPLKRDVPGGLGTDEQF